MACLIISDVRMSEIINVFQPMSIFYRWPSTNWLGLLTLKMGSRQEHFALSASLCRVRDGF
jgi:hypothetical protein